MKRLPISLMVMAVLAAVLVFMAGSSDVARADPGPVEAGYDLFETDSASLVFGGPTALPADFFGPGCNPFSGTVDFKGVPIGAFGAFSGLGTTDTIVQRLDDAATTYPDAVGDTIQIEIVRLELVSVAPLTITCPGGDQQWDMTAQVPEGDMLQNPGTMTIRHEYPNGGTFDTISLPVNAAVTFTKVGGGGQIGPFHLSDVGFPVFDLFTPVPAPWCHDPDPLLLERPGLTGPNFYPGTDCTTITLVDELHQPPWGGSNHRVRPVLTPVGGITEQLVDGSVSPASSVEGSGTASAVYAAIAGAAAAAVAMMAAGGWYARRRWLR
jgi:hypothetical protein